MGLPQIARLLGGLFAGGLIGGAITSGIERGRNEANSIHDEARAENQNSNIDGTPAAPKTPEELQAEIDKLTAARDSIIEARRIEELDRKFEQDVEREQNERYERLMNQLAPYGIDAFNVCDVFDNAKEIEIDGKKHLVLSSKDYNLELEVPLDETYRDPSYMEASADSGTITLKGFNGTLKKTKTENEDWSGHYQTRIENGNIKYIGKYGNSDTVVVEDGSVVEFVTDDWADEVYDVNGQHSVQPGTYKFPEPPQE